MQQKIQKLVDAQREAEQDLQKRIEQARRPQQRAVQLQHAEQYRFGAAGQQCCGEKAGDE